MPRGTLSLPVQRQPAHNMLTSSAAIAGLFACSMSLMMIIAAALGVLFGVTGLAISYGLDLPSGAVTIILAGDTYLTALTTKRVCYDGLYTARH